MMRLKLTGSIVIGSLLGALGAGYVFIGSWISLVPWGLVGFAIGATFSRKHSLLMGGLYGFSLSFAFMIAGYAGSASILSRLPFFAVIGSVGGGSGIVLALLGNVLRRVSAATNENSPR